MLAVLQQSQVRSSLLLGYIAYYAPNVASEIWITGEI